MVTKPKEEWTYIRVVETGNYYATVSECATDMNFSVASISKWLNHPKVNRSGYTFVRETLPRFH